MKKRIAAFLAITLVFSLVGCANKSAGKPSNATAEQTSDGRTILKLAATYQLHPHIQERIDTFNNSNPDYFVEVLDYTPGENEEYDAGSIKLRTDILGGNAPDLIELDGMPLSTLTNKGLLEDLTPYLEKDADLGSDSLVTGAYRALKDESGLHRIAPFFYLSGLYGKASAIGEADSWTFEEMSRFLEKNSTIKKPFVNMKAKRLLSLTVEQFINKDGTCSFDSPQFISLLNVLKKYEGDPGAYVDNQHRAIANGEYLLGITSLGGVNDYAAIRGEMGGDMKMIGMPTQSSSGNVADFPFTFGMLSDSPSKEGCWQFLKTFLDKDYQSADANEQSGEAATAQSGQIPVLKAAFDAAIQQSSAPQGVKEEFVSLVDGMQFANAEHGKVQGIIVDQLPALYDGSKSAEEIAKAVQNKASLYLSENQ